MQRLSFLLAAIPLLAGCVGHCGYTPDEASWTEPGLYAWMQANQVQGATWSEGEGLPLDLDVEGQPLRLRALTWEPALEADAWVPQAPHFRLVPSGAVTASVDASTPEEELRRLFAAFAGNVSAAGAPELAAAEDAFVASRARGVDGLYHGPEGEATFRMEDFAVMLPGPYRFEALFAQSNATVAPGERPAGQVSASGGDHLWELSVPAWEVRQGARTIVVDAFDLVHVAGGFREGDGDADIERRVRSAFGEAGLPEPRLEGLQHGGVIC